jgi:hypothetical protein
LGLLADRLALLDLDYQRGVRPAVLQAALDSLQEHQELYQALDQELVLDQAKLPVQAQVLAQQALLLVEERVEVLEPQQLQQQLLQQVEQLQRQQPAEPLTKQQLQHLSELANEPLQ